MNLPTLILLTALLIVAGVCLLLGWAVAAFILLGVATGGLLWGIVIPFFNKRFFITKIEEDDITIGQTDIMIEQHNIEIAQPDITIAQPDTAIEQPPKETIERLSVRTGQKIDIIEIKDIVFFAANGDYVSIYTEKGVWLKELTMKELEAILPQERFVRVHRSFIVNILCVRAIDRYKKGQYLISLSNKEEVKMSESGYLILKSRLAL